MVQLSHPYMTTDKTIALTRWTFVGEVMSLLFNRLSRFVTAFLPRSKCLLIPRVESPSAVILEPPKNKICHCFHFFPVYLPGSDGNRSPTKTDFILGGSKVTADGDCNHEIKRCLLLRRKPMTNLDSILKSRHISLPKKVHLIKAMIFPVVMYGCESWTIKKAECQRIDAFKLWCWRRLLRVPWTARRANQSILKKSVLNIHWKD